MGVDDIVSIEKKKPTRIRGRHARRLRETARTLQCDIEIVGIVGRETYIALGFIAARLLRADLESGTDDIGQRNPRRPQILVEPADLVLYAHHRTVRELTRHPPLLLA